MKTKYIAIFILLCLSIFVLASCNLSGLLGSSNQGGSQNGTGDNIGTGDNQEGSGDNAGTGDNQEGTDDNTDIGDNQNGTDDNAGNNTNGGQDSTGDSTGDGSQDNTGDNTNDGGQDNTGDNIGDNTGDNTEDNMGDNTPVYTPSAEVMSVKGGANGIVVLMHDDGHLPTASVLDKLYKKYDLVGDVALITKRVYDFTLDAETDVADDWRDVLATDRWKVVSHSSTHNWWGTATDDGNGGYIITDDEEKLYREVATSQEILRELFADQRVLTFAYPGFSTERQLYAYTDGKTDTEKVFKYIYSENMREMLNEYYISSRGFYTDDINVYDTAAEWNCAHGQTISNNNIKDGRVSGYIETAVSEGDILLFYMHKVLELDESTVDTYSYASNEMASYYTEILCAEVADYVERGLVWNTHYEDAVLYVREAQTSSVSISGDENALTVVLTDGMDDSIYNYALTVRVEVPETWSAAKIVQGDTVSYAVAKSVNGKWVIDAEIVPDVGDVTVTPVSASEIPADDSESKPAYVYTESTEGEEDNTSDGVVTFESGDTDTVTNKENDSLTYEIVADPEDSSNKALKVTGDGTGSGTLYSYLDMQVENSESTLYVFEADIYIDSSSQASATALQIGFSNSSKGTPVSELRLQLKDGIVNILSGGDNPAANTVLAEGVANVDEWFGIRVELTYTGSATALVKVYVNNTLAVAETAVYKSAQVEGYEISTFRIRYNATKKSCFYFDNLTFYQGTAE